MPTITGIPGGTQPGAQRTGLQKLKELDAASSWNLLTRLGNDISNKSGVVRLLHTSNADKEMKFRTAGAFKQAFLDGGKLQTSGQVIRDLLANAGAKPQQLSAFDAYLTRRGRSGVEASRVRQEIVALRSAGVGSTREEALAQLGVSLDLGRVAGEGGFGKVRQLMINGEPHVFKEAIDAGANLGKLVVRAENGEPGEPPIEAGRGSAVRFQDSQAPAGHRNGQEHVQMPGQAAPQEIKRARGEYDLNTGVDSAQGGRVEMDGVDVPEGGAQPVSDAHPAQSSAQPPIAPAPKVRLDRAGLAVGAYVKSDIPEVVVPSIYVVRESNDAQGERFHAVRGGAALKAWARAQNPQSEFVVTGSVMPMAHGGELVSSKGAQRQSNVPEGDLNVMAAGGLIGLQNMSRHGFIHGDIKPLNMFWDPDKKEVKFIDFDGAKKISAKRPGAEAPKGFGAHTPTYAHPLKGLPLARMGSGRDLYAFGMTVLETAAHSRRDPSSIALTSELKAMTAALPKAGSQKYWGDMAALRAVLKTSGFPKDSAEDFGIQAMLAALESEAMRMAGGAKHYDRWEAQLDEHPLNKLAQHPAVAGLMQK